MRRLSALVAAVVMVLLAGGAIAWADAPFRAGDRVTDRAGALNAAGKQQVTAAITQLRTDKQIDLFVIYVRSFDGADGQAWADRAAQVSQLGQNDVLMAVATQDRAYGISYESSTISQSTVDSLASDDVEPKLGANDWAGAAVALADGLRTSGSGSGLGTLAVVGGLVVVGGGAYAISRRRRRKPAEVGPAAAPGPPAQPQPKGEFDDVETSDLDYRASQALLDVDNAVQTSDQELSAARAHFGDEAVAPFAAALAQSRADMVKAFEIRQQLDDDQPETEPQKRALDEQIIALCRSADQRLDAQVAAFDQLRSLEAKAPEYVDGLAKRLQEVSGRVPQVEAAWATLRGRYAPQATEPVAGNVEQAKQLVAAAGAEIAEAQTELTVPGPAAAVVSARTAEDALTQAETLLDGIGRRDTELGDATQSYAGAKAEIQQDLAEARAMVAGTPGVGPLVARAEAAIAAADQAMAAAPPDPIAALRLLDEANTSLDAGISDAREQADRTRRAAAALEQALLTARSSVSAAQDFVTTRRGAVGGSARTRLAEAQRHLQIAQSGGDPSAALVEAQQADGMAQEALRLAQSDVSQWSSGPVSRGGSGLGVDLGSLVLGGILSGGFNGGGGGYGGGGYGGGSRGGGGGFGGGGSFGGSSSGGRRTAGGRF